MNIIKPLAAALLLLTTNVAMADIDITIYNSPQITTAYQNDANKNRPIDPQTHQPMTQAVLDTTINTMLCSLHEKLDERIPTLCNPTPAGTGSLCACLEKFEYKNTDSDMSMQEIREAVGNMDNSLRMTALRTYELQNLNSTDPTISDKVRDIQTCRSYHGNQATSDGSNRFLTSDGDLETDAIHIHAGNAPSVLTSALTKFQALLDKIPTANATEINAVRANIAAIQADCD